MAGTEFSSFKICLGLGRDDSDLSDEDDGGAQPNEKHLTDLEDDYFSGALSSFSAGCLPTIEEQKIAANSAHASVLTPVRKLYIERCKEVGRLGPPKTQLDRSSAFGTFVFGHERAQQHSGDRETHLLQGMDGSEVLALDIEAKSNFVSIRANTAVFKDTFYYEATLLSDGLMQIGWCSINTNFDQNNGVGDSSNSYAYDGYRVEKWNVEHTDFGQRWAVGDVIGTLINFNTSEILYWRNSIFLGVAFTSINTGPNRAYFPAASLQQGQRLHFNFG